MSDFIYPKPRDWNSLEDIIADVFSREIDDPNLVRYTRYGRQGQEQYGVDVVGFKGNHLVGFQSKNHPKGKISEREAKGEITKADKFRPQLSELVIVTSADRDKNIQKVILKESKARKAKGRFSVGILFWEDVCDLILKYPDLTYKYFTRYFPATQLEKITLPGLHTPNRITLAVSFDDRLQNQLPQIEVIAKESGVVIDSNSAYKYTGRFTPSLFNKFVTQNLEALIKEGLPRHRSDQYRLAIGFATFPNVTLQGVVDLDLNYAHLLDSQESVQNLQHAAKALTDFKAVISTGTFSNELTVYMQARLAYAFLFGWIFRKVTKFDLNLVAGNQVWTTKDLPHVPSGIRENLPEITQKRSKEVALILNFTARSITKPVKDFLKRHKSKHQILLDYELSGPVTSAAHALSIARAVALNIKNISDQWDASKIHLFMAAPAPLATLIAYHLNGIKPIHLYFYNEARTGYELGGIITNNT